MNHTTNSLVSEGLYIIYMSGMFATSRHIMVSLPWFLAHCQFFVCAGHDVCSYFVNSHGVLNDVPQSEIDDICRFTCRF